MLILLAVIPHRVILRDQAPMSPLLHAGCVMGKSRSKRGLAEEQPQCRYLLPS